MDAKNQVREFILKNFLFGDESRMPDDNGSFLESSIVDSTGMLEVIGFIESTFKIKVEDNELLPENLDSLENIARFVEKKLGVGSQKQE